LSPCRRKGMVAEPAGATVGTFDRQKLISSQVFWIYLSNTWWFCSSPHTQHLQFVGAKIHYHVADAALLAQSTSQEIAPKQVNVKRSDRFGSNPPPTLEAPITSRSTGPRMPAPQLALPLGLNDHVGLGLSIRCRSTFIAGAIVVVGRNSGVTPTKRGVCGGVFHVHEA